MLDVKETIEHARLRVQSAERALKEAKVTRSGILDSATILKEAKINYNLLVANAAADSLKDEGTDGLTREQLLEAIKEVTWSKLDYGRSILMEFENAQRYGGRFSRWDCRARDVRGALRPLSLNAWDRVLEILSMYCPRRMDNGLCAPPYRIRLNEYGRVVPETAN